MKGAGVQDDADPAGLRQGFVFALAHGDRAPQPARGVHTHRRVGVGGLVVLGAPGALKFLKDRMKGVAPTNTCASIPLP